jgi:hypothetical protein
MSDPQTLETTVAAGQVRSVDGVVSESIHAAAVEAAYILEAVRK